MQTDDNDNRNKPNTRAELVAKAEASLKIERIKHINVDEPEDVTRANAQAFLDAVSPFTESLGMLGDWLGDKRALLRAQRSDTLAVVASKARKLVDQRPQKAQAIPVKALLPILDRASLEEADDDTLTSAWAALISGASVDYDAEVLTFSRILSEISARECLILEHLLGKRWPWIDGNRSPGAMREFYESEHKVKPLLKGAIRTREVNTFESLYKFVDPVMPIDFVTIYSRKTSQRANWTDVVFKSPFFAQNEPGYRVLEAQGLITMRGHGYSWGQGELPVGVDWVELTELGMRFVGKVVPRT